MAGGQRTAVRFGRVPVALASHEHLTEAWVLAGPLTDESSLFLQQKQTFPQYDAAPPCFTVGIALAKSVASERPAQPSI